MPRSPAQKAQTAIRHRAILDRYPVEGAAVLAAEFGTTPEVIWKTAEKLGVKTTWSLNKKLIAARAERCDQVDGDYFERWSPNSAWLLGYIWTDGCIRANRGVPSSLAFVAQERDSHIVFDIKRELKATQEVCWQGPKAFSPGGRTGQRQVTLSIGSQKLAGFLVSHRGICLRKSSFDHPLPDVPTEFLPHFFRGVVDGDGWVSAGPRHPVVGVCNTAVTALNQLSDAVSVAANVRRANVTRLGSPKRCKQLVWTSRRDVQRLYEWMYPAGDYLRLDRKHRYAASVIHQATST